MRDMSSQTNQKQGYGLSLTCGKCASYVCVTGVCVDVDGRGTCPCLMNLVISKAIVFRNGMSISSASFPLPRNPPPSPPPFTQASCPFKIVRPDVVCPLSFVTCHSLPVSCHLSLVTCHSLHVLP